MTEATENEVPPFLKTERVELRLVTPDDAPLILKWKQDPLVRKMAHGRDRKTGLEEQIRDINQAIESKDQLYFVVCLANGHQPVGYIRVEWIDDQKRFAWLRLAMGERRREGYMTEALSVALMALFKAGMHRVEAEVNESNTPCLKLLNRLGFVREGVKRQAHCDGGSFCDIIFFGLLEADFGPRLDLAD